MQTGIWKWLYSEPEIVDKDLRPYYYACKEKIDYFSGTSYKNDLSEIVDLLFRDEMVIAGRIDAIPVDKVGLWIIQGWDKAIPRNCGERKELNQYYDKLKDNGAPIVKNALKNMRGE